MERLRAARGKQGTERGLPTTHSKLFAMADRLASAPKECYQLCGIPSRVVVYLCELALKLRQ